MLMVKAKWESSSTYIHSAVLAFARVGQCKNVDRIIGSRALGERAALDACRRSVGLLSRNKVPRTIFRVDEFRKGLLLEHKGERQAALAICSEIYTKRQDAIGSLDISRALTGCTTLWVATSDVAKVMDVQRVLFPFMTNGEEPAAQLAWRALQNGDKTEARKFAWKVRSHRRREALLARLRGSSS